MQLQEERGTSEQVKPAELGCPSEVDSNWTQLQFSGHIPSVCYPSLAVNATTALQCKRQPSLKRQGPVVVLSTKHNWYLIGLNKWQQAKETMPSENRSARVWLSPVHYNHTSTTAPTSTTASTSATTITTTSEHSHLFVVLLQTSSEPHHGACTEDCSTHAPAGCEGSLPWDDYSESCDICLQKNNNHKVKLFFQSNIICLHDSKNGVCISQSEKIIH